MDGKLEICFSAGVKYKGLYYLSAIHMNALFLYNEENDKLTFLTSFKKEEKQKYLHLKAFLYKDEAWFIPYTADYIAIYNFEKNYIDYMPLIFCKEYKFTHLKYINILFFEKKFLCLVPQDVDATMIINLEEKRAKAYNNIANGKKAYPYHSAVFIKGKIYFFPWNETKILELDLKTDSRNFLPWRKKREDFRDAVYDEKKGVLFYSPAKENCILIEDLYGKLYKKIKVFNWDDEEYRTCFFSENVQNIFFWGHEKNIVVKINRNDYKVKSYYIKNESAGIYFFPIESENIEALVFEGNCIIKYDEKKDRFLVKHLSTTLKKFICEIGRSDASFFDIVGMYKDDNFKEDNKFELQHLIFYTSPKKRLNHARKINIGSKIYKYL